jgi:RNA polymerase sigma-70 factor (ECF subfamily)
VRSGGGSSVVTQAVSTILMASVVPASVLVSRRRKSTPGTFTGLGEPPQDADETLDLLARRASAGDKAAAARLCAAFAPSISRYFRRTLGNAQEAEEATQQVMVNLLAALPRYRDEGTPFRAFVFRLAHNHTVDRLTRRGRLRAMDPQDIARIQEATDRAPAAPSRAEQRDSLETLIAPLPTAQQQVIRLIYQHDLTPAQAGVVLGRSATCVRQLHKRARDALREIVLMQSNV